MTTMMVESTGSALGDLAQLASHEVEVVDRHTSIGIVGDPALRDALGQFDVALTGLTVGLMTLGVASPVHAFIIESGTSSFDVVTASPWLSKLSTEDLEHDIGFNDRDSGQDDAVTAVDDLASRLGVPVRDVLAAVGISRSTFYSWRSPTTPRPRVASQGRLWALMQVAEDLNETLAGSLRAWLLAEPDRRALLRAGDFDALLGEATSVTRRSSGGPSYSAAYAVGGDRGDPDVTVPRPPQRRRVKAARPRSDADRRSR